MREPGIFACWHAGRLMEKSMLAQERGHEDFLRGFTYGEEDAYACRGGESSTTIRLHFFAVRYNGVCLLPGRLASTPARRRRSFLFREFDVALEGFLFATIF